MQVGVRDVHHREHDRERQRNCERNDRTRPHAEADEAARENDDDRLPQRRHEVVDRFIHGYGLVGDQHRLYAVRQIRRDVGHLGAHVVAKRQDVAGIAHRYRKTDRGLAVDSEHRLRRIHETAPDGCDVTEPEDPVARYEVDVRNVGFVVERPGHAQEHAFLFGLYDTGGTHQVLRLQRRKYRGVVEPHTGEPLGRELDEDLFVLLTEHFDLRYVRQLQQPRTRGLDVVAQLAEREAIRREGIDDPVRVAEIVVEERADDAGR